MKHRLPTRRMREHRDLDQLKRQAKELLRGFIAGEAEATPEVNAHYRVADASTFALSGAGARDAQGAAGTADLTIS